MVFSEMRSGELSQLMFQDIDWENKILWIVSDKDRKTKTRKSRIIPLSSELGKELNFLRDHCPNLYYGSCMGEIISYLPRTKEQTGFVFCHRDGQQSKSSSALSPGHSRRLRLKE